MRVFGNVVLIVYVEEGIAGGPAVNGRGCESETEAGYEDKIETLSIHWTA
jgi:hypothetical protein